MLLFIFPKYNDLNLILTDVFMYIYILNTSYIIHYKMQSCKYYQYIFIYMSFTMLFETSSTMQTGRSNSVSLA